MNASVIPTPPPRMARRAATAVLALLALAAPLLSSCASLSPDQQADNSETRFMQEMQRPASPGNAR
jgi:ABC-type Fe2+-enterobactin transport system substrate-binding protein